MLQLPDGMISVNKTKLFGILTLSILCAATSHAMESASKKFGNRSGEVLRTYLGIELYGAARFGDIARMNELLAGGADVNYEEPSEFFSKIALSEAISSGQKEAAELLIKSGANLFWRGPYGRSVLSSAGTRDSFSFSELIVEKMLSIPTLEQKKRIYTFMHSLKCRYHRTKYAQFKDVFKNALRGMIQEENAPKVLAQIKALSFYKQKKYLLKKYFSGEPIPEKDGCFRLCGGARMA